MKKPDNIIQLNYPWYAWIGRLWALPYTLLGLILGSVGRNHLQLTNRTIEIHLHSGPTLWCCNRIGISAFTLGDSVLYAVPPCRNLRIHEHRHTLQYWILGPLFLPIYYILLAIYGYWNHPLEKDARAYEITHCGSLYSGTQS